MQNILKTLYISKILFVGLILLCVNTISLADDRGVLSKTHVDSLKQKESKLWYVDKFRSEQKPIDYTKAKENDNSGSYAGLWATIAAVFKVLVWAIVGLALIGACYVIFKNLKNFKFKSNPEVVANTTELTAEVLDIKAVRASDLTSQIDKCIQDQNFRLAIRYYYLWVMKMLSESELIDFNIDKTNQDYTRELSKKNTFSKEQLSLFIKCTHYYEYLWFGNFVITEPSFLTIERSFKDFLAKKA